MSKREEYYFQSYLLPAAYLKRMAKKERAKEKKLMLEKARELDAIGIKIFTKNVNEIFFQQLSNNENVTTNETHKSIYSKYPNIFKYEADAADRQWLTENSIIKRKNIKKTDE